MIFESDFFFNEIRRWNLGWPTPNYAGAWLATVLPWLWMACGLRWLGYQRFLKVALCLLEAGVWLALCMTFSRGGLLAALGGLGFFVTLRILNNRADWKGWLGWALLRVLGVGLLLGFTGFWDRVTPEYARSDGAVVNRLDLWQGGLQMMAAAPLSGWGAGESGRAYMNWFQAIDRDEGYATMVNSYLHVGVERGSPALALVLSCLLFFMMLSFQPGMKPGWKATLAGCAGTSLAAWALANVFTTLWIDWKLWLIPGAALALIVLLTPRLGWRLCCGSGALALGAGLLATGLFCTAGWALKQTEDLNIRHHPAGVLIEKQGEGTGERPQNTYWVWPDERVLGRSPGKAIREWMDKDWAPAGVRVQDRPWEGLSFPEQGDVVVLFGRQTARLNDLPLEDHAIYLIHPAGRPPATEINARWVLILPGVDTLGKSRMWRDWADSVNAELRLNPRLGQDIRAAWPAVMRLDNPR
ncbi:MAG: O-antigen ligase family protein [Opitutales bacterium]|nr:O-antigen ligase family protein [Opitutales bacterium]